MGALGRVHYIRTHAQLKLLHFIILPTEETSKNKHILCTGAQNDSQTVTFATPLRNGFLYKYMYIYQLIQSASVNLSFSFFMKQLCTFILSETTGW